MRKVLYLFLIAPTLYVLGFFAYVTFANDAGCGSMMPGLCFGVGLSMMVAIPTANVSFPIFVLIFIIDLLGSLKSRRMDGL